MIDMTFSEYIIQERSQEFYWISLEHIVRSRSTLESFFPDMYYDFKLLVNEGIYKEPSETYNRKYKAKNGKD